ncbi:putative DNA-binding transcriptional regulator YafY [Paenibacillus cellulosilyticus]|uniref:Putative DNA-binding transcriptional regulator YafY n=1 Tax=Paenibacillus cellulosilyticus TaxID=375489 RepID=A0A2V2YTH8_9BACL|nr:YafY family protein [Paenibacillus cellulosilyticus]PWW02421.1 putative DNA-binding transcriptional regulator YafY [Paenibacillus cellulosilyticus]QKS47132.1 YafY family transcriptional regulator [Paenibacillus cellulosilyticus]
MNKTDRLLAIVLELQGRKVVRAEDLAALFETSVRTIYRDIQALSEAGVPITGTTGAGYSLMEGYFLPPIRFTIEEAVTLLIGTEFIEQRFDDDYRNRANMARRKIEVTLSDSVRSEASRIRKSLRLLAPGKQAAESNERENLDKIRRALLDGRKISFHYSKRIADSTGGRHSERTAAPYGLVLVEGSWMLVARCDLRQDIRHFRLSRMAELIELDERFELPPHFDLREYTPLDDRHLRVCLRFDHDIADKVKESNYHYIEDAKEHQDGLDVVLRVRLQDEVLQWVLGWGAGVIVLEPESFRNRIREEAQKMLKRY